MQISPNAVIPVSYVTTIPGDTTLYYVQAVLRDTQSSTILQTLNLTRKSSTPNRYTGTFNPVSDPSGLGRNVDVTISVYTDSGYTTLSGNYQILQLNYTVLQPWIQNLGTGGGLNIDYDKLQKMFDGSKVGNEEIGNEVAKHKTRIDYKRIEGAVMGASEGSRSALSDEIKNHITSVLKQLDGFSKTSTDAYIAHGARFDALETRINTLESKLDTGYQSSSKERISMKEELSSVLKEMREESKKSGEEGHKKMETRLKEVVEAIQDHLTDNLSEKEIKMVYQMTPMKREKEEKKQPSFSAQDIASLLR